MDHPTCPKCHKIGVQKRVSNKTQRPYFANVQTYDSGHSYFRGLHTTEECDAHLADFNARVAAAVAHEETLEAARAKNARAEVLIPRYKAIYGPEALATNWHAVADRWLPRFTTV